MSGRALLLGALVAGPALAGCVGQAGIGADGSAVAERETSIYRYEKTLPDGSTVKAEAIIAKKAQVQGLEFRSAADGSVVMLLDSAESGDRTTDQALAATNTALESLNHIIGAGGMGARMQAVQVRKTAKEQRQEARSELRRQESLRRTQEAEVKRLEAERRLLMEQERLRREAEAREAAEGFE